MCDSVILGGRRGAQGNVEPILLEMEVGRYVVLLLADTLTELVIGRRDGGGGGSGGISGGVVSSSGGSSGGSGSGGGEGKTVAVEVKAATAVAETEEGEEARVGVAPASELEEPEVQQGCR